MSLSALLRPIPRAEDSPTSSGLGLCASVSSTWRPTASADHRQVAALPMECFLVIANCIGTAATCNRTPQKAPISHHPQLLTLAIVIARMTMSSTILRMLIRSSISRATVTDRPITWYIGTRWHPTVLVRQRCCVPLLSQPPTPGEPVYSPFWGISSPGASQDSSCGRGWPASSPGSWVACSDSSWAASVFPSWCPSKLVSSLALTSGRLAASSCWAPLSLCNRHHRSLSTLWTRTRSPQTCAATPLPSPDSLTSILSDRRPGRLSPRLSPWGLYWRP